MFGSSALHAVFISADWQCLDLLHVSGDATMADNAIAHIWRNALPADRKALLQNHAFEGFTSRIQAPGRPPSAARTPTQRNALPPWRETWHSALRRVSGGQTTGTRVQFPGGSSGR